MELVKQLESVKSFEEWDDVTRALDDLDPRKVAWRDNDESDSYAFQKTKAKTAFLQKLRTTGDIKGLIGFLRQDLVKNIGQVASPELYKVCRNGTKRNIERYHNEVIRCIQYVYYYKGSKLRPEAKLKFFELAGWSYGKTALMLSGGAAFGKFHYGLIKALYELDLMPRIIVGSSAGSLCAAYIAVHKFEELHVLSDYEITFGKNALAWNFDSLWEMVKMISEKKIIASTDVLKTFVRDTCKDLTFGEIYE